LFEVRSVRPKTRRLDGKIQFLGVVKKMIVSFTGGDERLFFLTQRRKWSFWPNTKQGFGCLAVYYFKLDINTHMGVNSHFCSNRAQFNWFLFNNFKVVCHHQYYRKC